MPSTPCPDCGFVVAYVDDLVGALQCPRCGEVLRRGPEVVRTAEPDEEPPLPGPPPIAPPRPAEPASRDDGGATDDDLPTRPDPPAGVRGVSVVWAVAGWLGVVLNFVLLLALGYFALRVRGDMVLLPLGFGVAMFVAAVVFYSALIRMGRAIRQGRRTRIQPPGWFVLFAGLALLAFNAANAVGLRDALDEASRTAPADPEPVAGMVTMAGWYFGSALLLAVDVALVVSAMVLLWQSGPYAHWLHGSVTRVADRRDRPGFPPALAFAGRAWLAVGLGAAVAVVGGAVWLRNSDPTQGGGFTLGVLLAVVLLALTPLLTCAYLGLLLLRSRLPTTAGTHVFFLVLALLGLLAGLANLVLPIPAQWMPRGLDFETVMTLRLVGGLVGIGLSVLAVAAAVAGIRGDGPYQRYQHWLREVRAGRG